VRFDDRLRTVLAQPAESPHDRAVRWRQLVELAARAPPDRDRALLADAIAEVRSEADSIDERVRAAAALAVASLPVSADLVAAFAADRLDIAAPVLANARLTPSEWKAVAAAASDDCRAFLATMRSEQAPPAPAPRVSEAPHAIPSISDVVARIERVRQAREPDGFAPAARPRPTADSRLFRWECGESGEIEWVEGAPRGALVGQTIAQRGSGTGVDRTVERAFASRAPFHDGLLELPDDVAIGGSWKISGVPAFEPATGRFAGYRGIAERFEPSQPDLVSFTSDPNSLRELAHEIKTPLNAIIGFAEIITGEYLGPADSRYRQRAAEIVTQARLLLSATEDLDFAAKIHSANGADKARCDLGEAVERIAGEIRQTAANSGVEIDAPPAAQPVVAAVQPELAERLILRMCGAVLARSVPNEKLRLAVESDGANVAVSISLPSALQGAGEDSLFGTADDAMSAAFPLRLARGLAQAAGASLIASGHQISLLFPGA
jgi:hypothetical protein